MENLTEEQISKKAWDWTEARGITYSTHPALRRILYLQAVQLQDAMAAIKSLEYHVRKLTNIPADEGL